MNDGVDVRPQGGEFVEGSGDGEENEAMVELPIKLRRSWQEPTNIERGNHCKLHCPYRAWCEFCVKGKADSTPHRRRHVESLSGNPVVSVDYMYMKASEATTPTEVEIEESSNLRGSPILVTKCSATAWISANVVPTKGDSPEGVRRLGEEVEKLGHQRLVLKSDQEPAIKALLQSVKREKHQDISFEHSPVAEHQSNGVAERAVKSVQGQVRTLKLALEARISEKVAETSDVVPWMIRHAAMLLNIGQRGDDGRTAWERVKGRRFNREIPEFGERVMYLKPDSLGKDKLDSRWETGHFLGIQDDSAELIIGTSIGVLKVRSVRSYTDIADRWKGISLFEVVGVPWCPIPGRDGVEIKGRVKMASEFGDRMKHDSEG